MIVLDASVAVKWFIPETGDEVAQELFRENRRFGAPAIIKIEVAGAFLRCYRENRLSAGVAKACCRAWDEMLIKEMVYLIADRDLYDLALKLAFEVKHTVQDSLYLAAAKSLKAPLVTADKLLFDRGSQVVKDVRLLESANDR